MQGPTCVGFGIEKEEEVNVRTTGCWIRTCCSQRDSSVKNGNSLTHGPVQDSGRGLFVCRLSWPSLRPDTFRF